MNERIRELREQAWALVSNEERDRGELYEAREQWERCDQRFAALIIKKCRDVVSDTRDQAIDEDWNIDEAMSTAMFDIEDYFGVE